MNAVPQGGYLRFATTAFTSDINIWNNAAPTSTVFSLGTSAASNDVASHVAYCFAEIEGFSKFGSYTGNGSADGPFVNLGFRPAFVMIKRVDSVGSWITYDAARSPTNVETLYLLPDLANAEATADGWDATANGFKLRQSNITWNANGGTYIYAAFAEHPFGGSNVSPSTAR